MFFKDKSKWVPAVNPYIMVISLDNGLVRKFIYDQEYEIGWQTRIPARKEAEIDAIRYISKGFKYEHEFYPAHRIHIIEVLPYTEHEPSI